jgi:hypothetical protein
MSQLIKHFLSEMLQGVGVLFQDQPLLNEVNDVQPVAEYEPQFEEITIGKSI